MRPLRLPIPTPGAALKAAALGLLLACGRQPSAPEPPRTAEGWFLEGRSRETARQPAAALAAYRRAAEAGHAKAAYRWGLALLAQPEPDPEGAALAFALALEHRGCDFPEAAQALADLYDTGRGVVRDPAFAALVRAFRPRPGGPGGPSHDEAREAALLKPADPRVLQQDPDRLDLAGRMAFIQAAAEAREPGRLREALATASWCARQAPEALQNCRHPRAFSILANRLAYGGPGLPADPEAARPWFEAGARLDDADAWQGLARLHAQGLGTPVDRAKAAYARGRASVAMIRADTGC